ncbi:MAG TPA: Fe-S protein assembly co-chaperone HscB [Alcaligenaceae bacterium]|nr:Fe-S protein assembly co-chaperone HscB [Alcaligenaceae bacterium]
MSEQDYFSLLGLPCAFVVAPVDLESAWKRASLAVHPDRFATASPAEKRVAMQWSSRVNEAYRVLKSPLLRARYLCELAGIDLQVETNTAMSPAFLMQQMEWHEQLESIQASPNAAELAAFEAELHQSLTDLISQVEHLLDAKNYQEAAVRIREWMFLDKLIAQLRAIET